MATETILIRFRSITGMAVGQYADADFTASIEPIVLARLNNILSSTYTITSHTTGSSTILIDEILSWLACAMVYSETQRGAMNTKEGMPQWMVYEQHALKLISEVNPKKVAMNRSTGLYQVIDANKANTNMYHGDWEEGV